MKFLFLILFSMLTEFYYPQNRTVLFALPELRTIT